VKVDYYFEPATPDLAREAALRARRIGFDGFFSTETTHDPFLPLVVAAGSAPELELGTAIAVAFPRSPMVVAQLAWDLASISGGRFILGLGTQVKAHIQRRFSTVWDSPGPRLREYILALREIFRCWQEGGPLAFDGSFYKLSLMTPFFNPGPIAHPRIPIAIAGVGPYLSRLAGELCQGFHIHPFHTVSYLDEVVIAGIEAGAREAGRSAAEVDRIASVFVVTGHDQAEMDMAAEVVRLQIAFYASTPTYRPVLDLHGWTVGDRLTAMSKRGEWGEMAALISDDMLEAVAVVAPFGRLGTAIRERYGDRIQRVGYYVAGSGLQATEEEWAALVAQTRAG
jgi:probable F420-dependent oxidoreductase